jgi:hypothetical protein
MSKVNIREQLEGLGKRPGMYGITRESLFVYAHVLLWCVGVDRDKIISKLGKVGNPPIITGNVISGEILMTMLVTPDDPWAQELSKVALSLLPEGTGEYEMTQIVPSCHDDIP